MVGGKRRLTTVTAAARKKAAKKAVRAKWGKKRYLLRCCFRMYSSSRRFNTLRIPSLPLAR